VNIRRFEAAGIRCIEVAPEEGGRQLPMVVCLHGLGDAGDSYVDIPPMINATDYRYIFPTAPISYAGIGWTWFSFEANYLAPGAARAAIQVTGMLDELCRKFNTPAERVALGGFSQGGMMTFEVGFRYPERLAGLFGLSTMLIAEAEFNIFSPPSPAAYYSNDPNLPNTLAQAVAQNVPIFMSHGLYDPVLSYDMGRTSYELMKRAGLNIEFYEFYGQHEITYEVLERLKAFLARCFA
jgi:phospholipase/carboxylesterase